MIMGSQSSGNSKPSEETVEFLMGCEAVLKNNSAAKTFVVTQLPPAMQVMLDRHQMTFRTYWRNIHLDTIDLRYGKIPKILSVTSENHTLNEHQNNATYLIFLSSLMPSNQDSQGSLPDQLEVLAGEIYHGNGIVIAPDPFDWSSEGPVLTEEQVARFFVYMSLLIEMAPDSSQLNLAFETQDAAALNFWIDLLNQESLERMGLFAQLRFSGHKHFEVLGGLSKKLKPLRALISQVDETAAHLSPTYRLNLDFAIYPKKDQRPQIVN